ncbi:hypothetical protein DF16_pBMB293orf00222 (plasmid) [Bacillus thuringiensis serovar kurstaki str. YBT-1520]|nr:hypothetical protein H175_285p293 [Bacillus thuringiensis serovar thuringiensis str. IS5056]AIM34746.1 hypothetical protein DF16_pBMB293orf00222 [Bacillus thuringiensis serovar kurstaki str. YBT-1520]
MEFMKHIHSMNVLYVRRNLHERIKGEAIYRLYELLMIKK